MPDKTPATSPSAPAPAPTLIKGSWEEKLLRGQQLIATQNDDAIPLLQQIIDRLAQMPEAQRHAANRRLDRILFQAITDLVFYQTYHDLYDAALANTALAARLAPPEQARVWQQHYAAILLQAGEQDTAFAQLEQLARTGELTQWHDLTMHALRHNRLDVAERALREAEHVVNRIDAGADEAALRLARGQLAYMKAQVALAQGKVDEALAWAEFAMTTSELFGKNPGFFYVHLVDRGHYDAALKLIRRDQHNPIRASFWGGVAAYRRGEHAQAEAHWRQTLRTELPEEGPVDFLELVMAHYYLGDKEGRGLAMVLDDLRREQEVAFGQMFLAGLGWALRSDPTAAHSNFRLAVMRSKSTASGRLLPRFWWAFCTDLLPAAAQDEYAHYFDTGATQPITHD
ncbi:MAG TPA: hypothetical protein GYA08_02375 [Chloroflexi bacterium]|nr:hypothetical protein [Chloroflexota bacterium]